MTLATEIKDQAETTPHHISGYLSADSGDVDLTDAAGNVLASGYVFKSRPIPPHTKGSWISNCRVWARIVHDGRVYSGSGCGKGMYFNARLTARTR